VLETSLCRDCHHSDWSHSWYSVKSGGSAVYGYCTKYLEIEQRNCSCKSYNPMTNLEVLAYHNRGFYET